MRQLDSFLPQTRVAYLSMEIALSADIHTYAGGLGILAGDTMRACAELELPVVFVTLASREGYFRQEIDARGHQVELPDPWDMARWAERLPAKVAVEIEGRQVWIQPWLHVHASPGGRPLPVLLLDTHLDENGADDRLLTDHLYGGDQAYRLKQELVLGVGGARMLRALGFDITTFHLNEGHAAFLPVELMRRLRRMRPHPAESRAGLDRARAREQCVFTTHTPVEAGHDRFSYDLVERTTRDLLPISELRELAGDEALNMSRLALNLSGYVNGVARRHAVTTRGMFPGYDVSSITNGIHSGTWAHPAFAALFDVHVPHWRREPEGLVRADQIPDADVWRAHEHAKADLLRMVRERTGHRLDPDRLVIVFARRMTGYKRPDLLFSDLDRLRTLARRHPFQVVMAGKAHPRDGGGRRLIAQLHEFAHDLRDDLPVVFVPGYDMATAKPLVAGADIWLNTPLPPMEASGTSGMKAALNGALNLSTLDGWWLEACVEGVTGWGIPPDLDTGAEARALYDLLGQTVLPMYSGERPRWISMMKQSISKIACYFNTHRMMRFYVSEAYFR